MSDAILLIILILVMACFFKQYTIHLFGSEKEGFTFPIPMESAVDDDHTVPADIAYEAAWPRYITKDGNENVMLRNALKEKTKFVKQVIASDNTGLTERGADIAHGLYPKGQGWWADAINCEQKADNFYCKPKKKWIWPY